jgi:hypothetical protein
MRGLCRLEGYMRLKKRGRHAAGKKPSRWKNTGFLEMTRESLRGR